MRFLGASRRPADASTVFFGPGESIRRASYELGSWSPRLDRDFLDLGVVDLGEAVPERAPERCAFLGGPPPDWLVAGRAVVSLGPHLGFAGERGTLWFLGARAYSREQRDRARREQRLLPLHEVDLKVAALTAGAEIGPGRKVHVHLDLGLLPWASPREVWEALAALAGLEVASFSVAVEDCQAALAAEAARDMALLWW